MTTPKLPHPSTFDVGRSTFNVRRLAAAAFALALCLCPMAHATRDLLASNPSTNIS